MIWFELQWAKFQLWREMRTLSPEQKQQLHDRKFFAEAYYLDKFQNELEEKVWRLAVTKAYKDAIKKRLS
jgi:hypothetical protein